MQRTLLASPLVKPSWNIIVMSIWAHSCGVLAWSIASLVGTSEMLDNNLRYDGFKNLSLPEYVIAT